MALLTPPAERGPPSRNSASVLLEKHSQTETGFKTNCLPVNGENSVNSYCVVLTFKSAKIQWLVKEILASEALGTYFSWIVVASIKLITRMMDECLILEKMGAEESKIVSESDGNTAVLTVEYD